ncbi:hypothetical protein [Leekyejoonella antrihumi]|uniref:Uncharacterized protein n=1 Tax=Leekyejoonella antrihumi TaxID=1660198 RepID=A0A563DZX1_9MICO|nr:hypothetical protein [Leekyejoonella antrihumi]TWP35797.1 hypothetical protein FGL98_12360 [Leekyejoonella antrihumi]
MPEIDDYLKAAGYQQISEDERSQLMAYWSMVSALREAVDTSSLGAADPAISYTPWSPEHA